MLCEARLVSVGFGEQPSVLELIGPTAGVINPNGGAAANTTGAGGKLRRRKGCRVQDSGLLSRHGAGCGHRSASGRSGYGPCCRGRARPSGSHGRVASFGAGCPTGRQGLVAVDLASSRFVGQGGDESCDQGGSGGTASTRPAPPTTSRAIASPVISERRRRVDYRVDSGRGTAGHRQPFVGKAEHDVGVRGGGRPAIAELLPAKQLGATRDGTTNDADLRPYLRAFDALDADAAHLLLLAGDDAQVLATVQLIPAWARPTRWAARPDRGGAGQAGLPHPRVGAAPFEWATGRHDDITAPWAS